jgi:hypothetical protein
LNSHFFNHVADAAAQWKNQGETAALTFSVRNGLLISALAGSDVNRESSPMTFVGPFVSKLSVVAAYVAFAFVGAIVLGVF